MSNELNRLNVTKACTLKLPIENYVLDYFVILTLLFCHSERSVSGVKNLILFRESDSEESHPFFHLRDFSIRKFLRFPFA